MVPLPPADIGLERGRVEHWRENYLSCAWVTAVPGQNLGAETQELEFRSKLPYTVSCP
jgi:hypothetical protein